MNAKMTHYLEVLDNSIPISLLLDPICHSHIIIVLVITEHMELILSKPIKYSHIAVSSHIAVIIASTRIRDELLTYYYAVCNIVVVSLTKKKFSD